MSISRAIRVGVFAGIAGTFFVHAATAESVSMSFDGTGAGEQVKLTSSMLTGNVFAGQIHQTISGGSAYDGSWITFCTDLTQHVSGSIHDFDVVSVDLLPAGSPMGAAKAQAMREIFAVAAGSQLLGSTTNALAAAFQLAIWEVLVDFDSMANGHGLDITTGNLVATRTDGGALGASIMSHLAALFAGIGTVDASGVALAGLKSGEFQDQLIVVPAPGALALLVSVGCTRRRRR